MSRIKGSKNRYPAMEARITIRLPEKLLRELEKIAAKYGQNRSEAILEALRDHVKRG
jgi:metal-responsive CopG/Arc/MetJ family transcriptional regulator